MERFSTFEIFFVKRREILTDAAGFMPEYQGEREREREQLQNRDNASCTGVLLFIILEESLLL